MAQAGEAKRVRGSTVLLGAALALVVALQAPRAPAASSSVTVTMSVPTYTSIDATGCGSGVAGITSFGSVLPDTAATMTADCAVGFGSNATARLLLTQVDGTGAAMYRPSVGALDTTFGCSTPPCAGWTSFAAAAGTQADYATTVLEQSSGRIVTAGYGGSGTAADLTVTGHDSDGVDQTFGCATPPCTGIARLDVGGRLMADASRGAALQADDRILLVGQSNISGTERNALLARFTATGSPDTSFGCSTPPCSGVAELNMTADLFDELIGVTETPAGIVAVGSRGGGDGRDSVVARFTSAGVLDTSFGCSTPPCAGWRAQSLAVHSDQLSGVLVQDDGKIVAVGRGDVDATTASQVDGLIARFLPNGLPDTGFGCATPPCTGVVGINSGGALDFFAPLEIDRQGRILAAGRGNGGGTADMLIARLTPDGLPDTTFGCAAPPCSGWRLQGVGANDDSGYGGVQVTDDGRILQAGVADTDATATVANAAVITRYLDNGTLDTTWGCASPPCSGHAIHPIGAGAEADGLVLLGDGELAMSGWATTGATGVDGWVARLDAAPLADFDATGARWSSTSVGAFGACLRRLEGSASAAWTIDSSPIANDGDCRADSTEPWQAIGRSAADPTTRVASTTAPGSATARLRFGVRPGTSQPRGSYQAPLSFEVLAPG